MMPPDAPEDREALLDHVAMECMTAIEHKDHEAFMQAFEVLVTDLIERLSDTTE